MTSLPTAFETPVTIITWLCWPGLSPAWPIASGRKTNGTWTDRYTRKLAIMVNKILECLWSIVSTNFYLLFSISHNWWCVYADQNMSVPLILCCSEVHGQEFQVGNTSLLSQESHLTSQSVLTCQQQAQSRQASSYLPIRQKSSMIKNNELSDILMMFIKRNHHYSWIS